MCTSDENERAQVGELISDLVRDLEVSGGASVCACACLFLSLCVPSLSLCLCVCVCYLMTRISRKARSNDLISYCMYT